MNNRLVEINQEYENVLYSKMSVVKKNREFAKLMTSMEREFNIPMLRKVEFEQENRAIIALYRKISLSRKL